MNRKANLQSRPVVWMVVLVMSGVVWSSATVWGEAQPLSPADGAAIDGENWPPNPPYTHIYTPLDFIPGATAAKHTGYFSNNYDDVAGRVEDANLGEPPYPSMPNRYYVGMPLIPPANDTLVRGTTYYWTVDESDAEGQIFPGEIWEFTIYGYYAFEPIPPDEAVDVETDVLLSWLPGYGTCCSEVYIGTSWEDVNNAVYDSINPPPEFLETIWEPNILVTGLEFNTKYYWRVDEFAGRCMKPMCGGVYHKGDVWSFTTVSGEAQPEFPSDGAVIDGTPFGEVIYTRLDFIPGASAVEHTGYFSDNYDDVANRIEDVNLGPPPFPEDPGYEYRYFVGLPAGYIPGDPYTESLVRGTTYYWTVDERDAEGKIYAGDIWEFTILGFYAFAPDPPNEAVDVETDVLLSWLPGYGAAEHDVYIGTSYEVVRDARYDFNRPPDSNGDPYVGPDEYYITRMEPKVLVTGLVHGVKYYWRVDEVWYRLPPPSPGPVYYIGDVWCFTTVPHLIYVDVDAAGSNDGSNWENAYNYLQDALIEAESALKPVEIRVAEGIYKPDRSTADPNGSGDRTATFKLIDGVTLKGGYAGFGEANPNARDIELYETILSGDLDDNDGPDFANNGENSYSIVTGSGTDANAILDGFTITGGNANKPLPPQPLSSAKGTDIFTYSQIPILTNYALYEKSPGWDGGGMYNDDGSPTLSNCILRTNWARYGGGMNNHSGSSPKLNNCDFVGNKSETNGAGLYNDSMSNPILADCTFTENSAGWIGGAICNLDSSLIANNCMFIDNSAEHDSGGMSNLRGEPVVNNCTFSGNSAGWGGAMYNYTSSPMLTNCIFRENSARVYGGGISNYRSSPTITNCTFIGNLAKYSGGMENYKSSVIITNCRFSQNVATEIAGGMYNRYGDQTITNCTLTDNSAGSVGGGMQNSESSTTVTNCILWRNNAPSGAQISGTGTVSYSDVEGDWPGVRNINSDPCFIDAGGGDLRLSSDSPCIDAGYNNAPNLPSTDMDGHTRIIDGDCDGSEVVDMGVYEFNYVYLGDFDYNCEVDFADFSIVALAWLTEPADVRWNPLCNISTPVDNIIDSRDLRIICENWLAGK